MAGEWSALFKTILSLMLRWLPGWVLRWWYPIRKCQEYVTVAAHGVGPHIYVNAERLPAVVGLSLTFMSGLPFTIKIEAVHWELNLEGHTLTNGEQIVTENIFARGARQVVINEIHLSDGQARTVRSESNDCPILGITGYVMCESPVGTFKKNLQLQTRAFIYRGTKHQ